MTGKSKEKTPATHSSAPTSPAGEMPAEAGSRSLKSESRPAGLNDRWLVPGVCIFLAAIVWLVFGQTLHHEFVNYDDNLYVYENPAVTRGLNLKGIEWAFTHTVAANWHPLTMMSHMLDCQLYGLNAGGHHLTNVLLHTASVILLFLVLRQMMGPRPEKSVGATTPQAGLHPDKGVGATAPQAGVLWRSAFVAAVFAIHPLRVESVAWVAERKDVLSGLFFMLTLWAYARYAQRVTRDRCQVTGSENVVPASILSRATCHPSLFYCLVLLFFALGLMCKPMLVTLPLVLLLLDCWPLQRFTIHGSRNTPPLHHSTTPPLRLLLEKLPLLGLALASCVVTIFAQHEAIQSCEKFSLPLRMGNAAISGVAYLGQMFWPADLAVLYPFTAGGVGVSAVLMSLVLLAGISTGVFVLRRRHPCFLTGWLWYLIMLTPVIGFIQAGAQARADRYTYLPQIGLYLLLTWAAADLCAGWRHRHVVLGGGAAVILGALIFCARAQTAYWQNSKSLWTHTLACTSDNFTAHNNLGNALLQQGKVDEAIAQYQMALQIKPDTAELHDNLGDALLRKGKVDEAFTHCQRALEIKPDFARAHNNLGNVLLKMGKVDEAITHYQIALEIKPGRVEAHINLGCALLQKGNVDEAIVHFQKALQIKPDNAEAGYNLGNALLQRGNADEVIAHFQKALQIKPDDAEAGYNLGNVLLQKGRVDEAIARYQKALQIKPGYADAHINLGMALLQKGEVDEAIAQFQKALQIKPDYAEAGYNLGNALLQKGRVDEAITQYQMALQIKPDNAKAHNNLGSALLQKGRVDEAIVHFQKALQINPDYAGACYNLGLALLQKGNMDEAVTHFQRALQIKPDSPEVLNNLAWLLATCPDAHVRDGVQAVQYAGRACELTHYGVTLLVGTLAAAYAEAGRYDDAITAAQKACALATATGQRDLLERNQKLLALYRAHQPYHEPAKEFVPAAP